ncbi:hypothetical protein BG003_011639 [Podila horticola]|nr:hypothetical protein BG003_011639 [Podila horticola]
MPFFDVPELVELIPSLLTTYDLAQCVRVNKTWHALYIPFLWRCIPGTSHGHHRLRELIQEDYLAQQQLQLEEAEERKFSVLSKYGPWIQELALSDFNYILAPPGSQVNHLANFSTFPESTPTNRLGPVILQACPNLQKLTVNCASVADIDLLAAALRSHLRKLSAIELIGYFYSDPDSAIAEMLLACLAGWKNIRLPVMGIHSAEALIKHCPTLEALEVENTPGWTSAHMHQILSSCPRIHTFVTMVNGESRDAHETHFLAKDFINFDHTSNSLTSWKSESSLKVFRAKIMGIPRPGVTPYDHYEPPPEKVLREAYPGQSHELQHGVYKRLARFSHLEKLQLGHDTRDVGDELLYIYGDIDYQYECLEMSLNSGLWILEGLKELRVLDVTRMETKIGVDDVKWMVKHWPKLQAIHGMNVNRDEKEAGQWLKEECPWIKSIPFRGENAFS